MRKFFLAVAVVAAFLSLSAQDNTNDLYQQYLNQYKSDNKPAAAEPAPAPAAEPEKKEEPAPAAEPAPAPAAEPEKKEEPAAEPEKKEEAAAQPEEEKKSEESAENAEDSEETDKLAFETRPFFSVDAFGAVSAGISVFGGDVNKDESYRFSIDNAVVDLKGGNHMFDARLLFDLGSVDDDGKLTKDVLKDVSVKMTHPSYRNANGTFGLNVELQAGLFGLPFGIEGGYDHEITFANSPIKSDFLGGAFRDVGVSLGFDFLFKKNMDLDLTLFVFNGRNSTMLDGSEDLFAAPAFGIDIRYNYESRLYATAAASLVFGSAYHPYSGNFAEHVYTEYEDSLLYADGTPLNRSKMNLVMALGLDIGYNVKDDISAGVKAEFAFSHRDLYNPDFGDSTNGGKLLFDGVFIAGNSYDTYGFFIMPYATVYDFDMMARFYYYKAPHYDSTTADGDNANLGINAAFIYNFCDYAGVEIDYDFNHWTEHGYNPDNSKYTDTFNEHVITLALTGYFGFLWENKEVEEGGDNADNE